jgi:hypothetical protein
MSRRKVTDSAATFRAAHELFAAATKEATVERLLSESRIAKLKAAAELERQGKMDEALVLIKQVEREQARLPK